MKQYFTLDDPAQATWTSKDYFVIFGELMDEGYVNGLVRFADLAGLNVIQCTIGKRDGGDQPRALTSEELAGRRFKTINVPLEFGFDLDKDSTGKTPIDQLTGLDLQNCLDWKINWNLIDESFNVSRQRIDKCLSIFSEQLNGLIPADANVLIAHTMAGGVPRAVDLWPILLRVFRGVGEPFISNETFLNSEVGKLCSLNFNEVSAESFDRLVRSTAGLREKQSKNGKKVFYLAYGYHGSEVLLNGKYQWRAPDAYLLARQKKRLEDFSARFRKEGINSTVFNCPEIMTKSSAVLYGIELSTHLFVDAIRREVEDPKRSQILSTCSSLLKEGITLEDVSKVSTDYWNLDLTQPFADFPLWAVDSFPEVKQINANLSAQILNMHKDMKNLLKHKLSKMIVYSSGYLLLNNIPTINIPTVWLSHRNLAEALNHFDVPL